MEMEIFNPSAALLASVISPAKLSNCVFAIFSADPVDWSKAFLNSLTLALVETVILL